MTDPDATVTGEQKDLRINLVATTRIASDVFKQRLRLLAGSQALVFNLDKCGYASDLTSIEALVAQLGSAGLTPAGDPRHRLLQVDLCDPQATAEAVRAADGVLIVSAEYNWSLPGGLKNAIDWLSRYKDVSLKDKPVCIQSAAPGLLGGSRMQYHLRQCLTSVDCFLFGKPEVIVNMGVSKFDAATGALKDQAAADLVKQQMEAFGKFIARVKD